MSLSGLERQEKRHVPILFRSLLNPNTERRMRKFWREVFASTFFALEFAGNCETIHTTPTIGMTIISLPKKITRKFGRHGIMQGRTVLSLGVVVLLATLQNANAQKVVWRSDIRQAVAEAGSGGVEEAVKPGPPRAGPRASAGEPRSASPPPATTHRARRPGRLRPRTRRG